MTTPVSWSDLMNNAKGQLEPVPDGEYDVKVIDAQATKSQTDKLMFKVKFEITSGPHAPRKVWNNFTLSEDNPMALAIFFRNMAAMGLDAGFFSSNPSPDQVASALLNRPCRLNLGHRAFQGREMQDVKAVLPPLGGGPMAPGVAVGPVAPGAAGMPTPGPTAPGVPTVGPGPTVGATPPTPTPPNGPPPLPI